MLLPKQASNPQSLPKGRNQRAQSVTQAAASEGNGQPVPRESEVSK